MDYQQDTLGTPPLEPTHPSIGLEVSNHVQDRVPTALELLGHLDLVDRHQPVVSGMASEVAIEDVTV